MIWYIKENKSHRWYENYNKINNFYQQDISTLLKEFQKKYINKEIFKYSISEVPGGTLSLIITIASANLIKKITGSSWLSSTLPYIIGGLGFIVGQGISYCIIHFQDYKKGKRNYIKDMKEMIKSLLESTGVNWSIKVPLNLVLQNYFNIEAGFATGISQLLPGTVSTTFRFIRNYQRGIWGKKQELEDIIYSTEESRIL